MIGLFLMTYMALTRLVKGQNVFAHFMVYNSYSYSMTDWQNDMSSAKAIGIDGFVLNGAVTDFATANITEAYSAAEPAGFKLLFSCDMSYPWQQSDMVSLISQYAKSPSTMLWKGDVLVSTFSGESYGDSFFAGVKSTLAAKGITISLAPAFTSYRDPSKASSLLATFPSIDGFFNWWSWPADTNTNLTTATDLAYQQAIKSSRKGPYIMSVSPWQFKELAAPFNWVQLSDTLWKYRWEQAINEVVPDIVEIITWNDYPESHYIADLNPKVNLGPLAPSYVNGFTHAPWRIIAQYYITYFKTGHAPVVQNDQVIFWYRAHPKAVTCSAGDRPGNCDYPVDAVFAFALLSGNATVSLDIGSNHAGFSAGAGVTMGSVPFPIEDAQVPFIQIIKDGQAYKTGYGAMAVTQNCPYYNFNPYVGVVG